MFIDEAKHIYIVMPMYNLIGYCGNYSDASGISWSFKRDEIPPYNADLNINISQSLKYKASLIGKTVDAADRNSFVKNTKIVFVIKYLSNFWRSLEMPLINCKIHIELIWYENCILSSAENSAKFKITNAKLHVPIVTLSTKDNINLTKQLSDEFKRSGKRLEQIWDNSCESNRKRKKLTASL